MRLRPALVATLLALAVTLAVAAAAQAVGFRDFSYTGVSAPTSDKPQSKLWVNDGVWWGSLYNKTAGRYEIHRLDWATQTWSTTGVALDTRESAYADTLWDGTHLYVVSAGRTVSDAAQSAKVWRLSYSAGTQTYSLDGGFPVTISNGGMESITIARDTVGTVWATFVQLNQVYTTHTTLNDASWSAPAVLPLPEAVGLSSDDLSTMVSYDGKVGVMWGDQRDPSDESYFFASHVDGAPDGDWTLSTALRGNELADDHINLRSVSGDASGRVYAATKTSLNGLSDTLLQLLVLKPDGTWTRHTYGTVANNHTRPVVLIDTQNRQLYMFASAPCCSGGVIYVKQTSLDNISFPTGLGTPFIDSATDTKINNATSTKQNLDGTTDLVVLAGDDSTKTYLHNVIDLGGGGTQAPETTIDSGPQGTVSDTTATFTFSSNVTGATFQCRLDDAAFGACSPPQTYSGLAAGSHTFAVRAVDGTTVDPSPATRTWTIDPGAPLSFPAEADTTAEEATPTANRGTLATLGVDGDAGAAKEAFLRFTVSGLQGSAAGAKLRLYVTNGTGNGPAAYGTSNDWTETGLTWANRPPATTGILEDKGSIGIDTFIEYDVSATVSGNGTYSFVLDQGATTSSDGLTVNSRTATANVPVLLVTDGPVDTTPPETAIDSGPPPDTNSTSASLAFSSSDPGASFECRLDGAGFAACTSLATYSGLAAGSHAFEVRAIDAAGNVDATPATRTWTIDLIAPDAPVIASPPDGSLDADGDVTLSGTAEPSSTVEVLEGAASRGTTAASASGEWSLTIAGVPDGPHTYTATATDAAANTSAASLGKTVIVDAAAPETTIDSGPSGSTQQRSATFAFSADDPAATFECRLDAAAFAACVSPVAYADLVDASHTFEVRATDLTGHTDPSPATRTWTIDNVAPDTTITSGPSGTVFSGSASFSFAASEPATFECSLDGAAFAACASPASYSGLATGAHAFEVRATDAAGNADATPAAGAWTVDDTPFADGFEGGGFSAWTTVTTGGDGSATVQGTIFRAGAFAARLQATHGYANIEKTLAGGAQGDLAVSADFRVDADSKFKVNLFELFDSGGTKRATLSRIGLTGALELAHSGTKVTTGASLPPATWRRLELHVITAGSGTSTIELVVDGALAYSSTTASLGSAGITRLRIGETQRDLFDLYADDVVARI